MPSSPTPPDLFETLRRGYDAARDGTFLELPAGPKFTYGELEALAERYASALGAHGVEPGDRVVVQVAKSAEAVALYLACLRMGAIYVPLNPSFTPAEVEYFVADAEPAVVVTDPAQPFPSPAGPSPVVSLTLEAGGGGSLGAAADTVGGSPIHAGSPDDIVAILYTSGTTGRSKGAMLSNRALIHNATALHRIWGFGHSDVLLHPLPIFHAHGLFVALHCAMLSGCPVRFHTRFEVGEVLASLPSATVMMGVPTHYIRLLADGGLNAELAANIRLFTSGSAPMTTAIHAAFTAATGHRILERYGMTEAGMITSNPLDGERIPGTVGHALPGVEVRIGGAGATLGVGETGVVEIRGPNLFSGYWRRPDKTAADFTPDGFFITGDVGSLDASGRLTLEGRSGDMIISGGENVYPSEIEQRLDAIEGVLESAVVGLPHPDLGEAVTAFVAIDGHSKLSEAALSDALTSSLARFKQPRRIHFVDALPKNAMGKIQKAQLRADHRDLYQEPNG